MKFQETESKRAILCMIRHEVDQPYGKSGSLIGRLPNSTYLILPRGLWPGYPSTKRKSKLYTLLHSLYKKKQRSMEIPQVRSDQSDFYLRFRQYGLWDRYTDLYPSEDLIYTVGESNYTKDWFFAHVNRLIIYYFWVFFFFCFFSVFCKWYFNSAINSLGK